MIHAEKLIVGPLKTNCYILTSDSLPGQAMVIDPGFHPEEILKTLAQKELHLKSILLTHTHFDHIGGVDLLASRTGAPLLCPQKDEPGLSDCVLNFSSHFTRVSVKANTKPSQLLKEGTQILFGSDIISVLETPGHTEGSVCYKTNALLFSGDTLFFHGYGRTDAPGGNERALFSSLHRLFSLENLTVYPGHGGETSINEERAFFQTAFGYRC